MLLFLLSALAVAGTVIVDPGDPEAAASLTDGLRLVVPGDVVLVRPGRYSHSETGEDLPLYVPREVTIQASQIGEVEIDAEGADGVFLILQDDVVLEGLVLTGSTGPAVKVIADTFSLIECRIVENDATPVVLEGSGPFSVDGCEFTQNLSSEHSENLSSGIYGGTGLTVSDSLFVAAESTSYQIFSDSSDVLVQRSIFQGAGVRSAMLSVTDSLFVGSREESIPAIDAQPAFASKLTNITVVGWGGSTAISVGDDSTLMNSIVAHCEGVGVDPWSDDRFYAVSNLLYANTGGDWSGTDWTGTLGNLSADPLFRDFTDDGDWTNDDLRLSEGSPAIDAATADAPAFDLDGVPRPQDGDGDGLARPDIGCYEWGLIDEDGDGWYLDGGDCDDTDPDINPGVEDIPYNGIDEDCDGYDLVDVDGDGHDADHQGGDDCDDTDADIHPGAWDIPNNGIDEDCDGQDAVDSDGDGWPDDQDCEPYEPSIHPGAEERCNGLDDDCDGDIDEDDVCAGGDTGEEGVRTCGCGCRGGDDTGAAWLILALPLWLGGRRRRHAASRAGSSRRHS